MRDRNLCSLNIQHVGDVKAVKLVVEDFVWNISDMMWYTYYTWDASIMRTSSKSHYSETPSHCWVESEKIEEKMFLENLSTINKLGQIFTPHYHCLPSNKVRAKFNQFIRNRKLSGSTWAGHRRIRQRWVRSAKNCWLKNLISQRN